MTGLGNHHQSTKSFRWTLGLMVPLLLANRGCEAVPFSRSPLRLPVSFKPNLERQFLVLDLRGGDSSSSSSSSSSSKKKKKKKKSANKATTTTETRSSSAGGTTTAKRRKKTRKDEGAVDDDETSSDDSRVGEGKKVIGEAMEKDAAEALGDAIRSRGDQLRSENPLLDQIDQCVYSVGWGLGASDRRQLLDDYVANLEDPSVGAAKADDDGGVAGSPTSVLVNYFLKSHGGAHAIQCLCSILASSAGFASLLLVPSKNPLMKRVLLQRALLFAMTKHVTGLLGAAVLAAKAIPKVGLRKARIWMEQLAVDPVSHYVFYAACVLLWLPTDNKQPMTFAGDASWISAILVGPILLREVVSTMLVISDVLVLWSTSNKSKNNNVDDDDDDDDIIQSILQSSQQAINSIMSLLVTPDRWRAADPAVRQRILAKLTSKVSLAMELVTGMIIVFDVMVQIGRIVFGNASGVKPGFALVIKRLFCSRIYLQYLWTRQRKINKLVTDIRGGSAQLPLYVLDVLMDPRAAMGLPAEQPTGPTQNDKTQQLVWKDYVMIALGLDE